MLRWVLALSLTLVITCWPNAASAVYPPAPPKTSVTNVRWTAEARDWLDKVNREINTAITYEFDHDQYGLLGVDRWVEDPPSKRGDCEDYALTKRKRLILEGWPKDTLKIAIVRAKNQPYDILTYHAVLVVMVTRWGEREEIVLDNGFINLRDRKVLEAKEYDWVVEDVDIRHVSVY